MKAKKIMFLLLGTLFFLPFSNKAQEGDDPVFAINITLTHSHHKISDYVIYLKHKSLLDDTVTVKKGKELYVTLMRNEIYTFTFHKEGYRDRTMVLNTALPETVSANEWFLLNFVIAMTPLEEADANIPTAYAMYDNKEDDFFLEEQH